jgi:hypothetical protein
MMGCPSLMEDVVVVGGWTVDDDYACNRWGSFALSLLIAVAAVVVLGMMSF